MGVEFPILSSEVVRLIDCRERQLHEAVRQGVVHPQVVAGRRLWRADGVLYLFSALLRRRLILRVR